jgi:hypothetical protein
MIERHPLQLFNDCGRYYIGRHSDLLQTVVKLSGYFDNLSAAETAIDVWRKAEKMKELLKKEDIMK